jgi:hypothetical protein
MPGSLTTQGQTGTRTSAPVYIAFRTGDGVGTLDQFPFAAPCLACTLPCQRFVTCLAAPPHA